MVQLFLLRKKDGGGNLAATKLIALHINKGKTLAKTLLDRIEYAQNPEKTEDGNYVSSYECDPKTVHKFNALSAGIKEKEAKMAEKLALKKQIFNYADTREIYIQYRKSGYSKKFFEQNRQAITLHKAAKQAFNECGLEKIPTVKELNVMYHELMSEKKQMYSEYHQLKNEMQELMKARKNVERFLYDEVKNDEREKEAAR